MEKCDEARARAAMRRRIDWLDAAGCEVIDRRANVGDTIGDMMQSRSRLPKEAKERRILVQRPEQFDVRISAGKSGDFYVLTRNGFSKRLRESERFGVESQRRIQVGDDDAYVIDAHVREVSRRTPADTFPSRDSRRRRSARRR
jgi:hypothetical protein